MAGDNSIRIQPTGDGGGRFRRNAGVGDAIFRGVTAGAALGLLVLIAVMMWMLWRESQPAVQKFGWKFLFGSTWNPVTEEFGAVHAVYGTLVTTTIALLAAIPLSLGIAIFLSEIAPAWLRGPVGAAVELLAAVPSIVYGMWGLFVLAPLMRDYVQPWLQKHIGGVLFSGPPMGIGLLTAGLVLALMILPFIGSVIRDVFRSTPAALKESAYGVGATTWEVVRHVLIPYGRKAIIGAITLGLGRALGETMAVTFVIGNAHRLSPSLFAAGNSIASTLANEFTEADGEVYLAALVELGLVLFLITFVFLAAAQFWIRRLGKQEGR